jgi:site-specific DNA recombinase
MKSIAIYARVSTEQQVQQATIESQVTALKERVAADGHVLLPQDIYLDEGFSGSSLVRPALERLRDRIADGVIDRLYVHSPDRLARKYAYQVLLLDEMSKHGVTTVFLNGPTGKTAEDELLVQVQGVIAEYERAKIMERSRRGKIHLARQGALSPLGSAPYGFAYVKKSDGGAACYSVLLHEAKVVREVFHAFVHEQKSISDITRELNARNIPTRRGAAHWDRPTVWTILKNPAHMGKAAFGKTEIVDERRLLRPRRGTSTTPHRAPTPRRRTSPDKWIHIDVPAIISRELFDAAQAQLDRNKRLAQRNANGERYLVRGLTVCACCGYAFSGRSSKSHTYYYCQGRFAHRFGGQRVCGNPTISGEQLDDYVWRSVSALLKDPARMLEEWSRRQKSGGVTAELQQHRDDAARAVAAFERTMKRLVDAYEVGAIEVEDLKQRSDTVRARSERAQRELADAETRLRETVQLRAIVTQLDDFAARVRARLDALSWLERRTILRTLVAKIDIDEKGATIVYRLPSAERTPPPSGANPPSDGTSDQDNRTSCLLRKQRGRLVTGKGLASPLDARIALALPTPPPRRHPLGSQPGSRGPHG